MRRMSAGLERVLFEYGEKAPSFFSIYVGVGREIEVEELRKALVQVARLHPLAACRVLFDEQGRQFVTDEGAEPFPLTVLEEPTLDWRELAAKLLPEPFEIERGPMVKFFLLKGERGRCGLLSIFHHAVCDGISAVIFLEDLFKLLAGLPAERSRNYGEAAIMYELLPEELREQVRQRGRNEWLEDLRRLDRAGLPPLANKPTLKAAQYMIETAVLSEDETKAVVALAKREGLTVHSLLGAAALTTFAELYGESGGYERTLQSPCSCRGYLKEDGRDYFGIYIGLMRAKVDCSPGRDFREIAGEIRARFKEIMDSLEPLDDAVFLHDDKISEVMNLESHLIKEEIPDEVDYDLSISNMGRLSLAPAYGDYPLEEFYGPTYSAVKEERVIGVNSFNGRMFFTYIFNPTGHDSERELETFNRFRKSLLERMLHNL